MYPIHRYMDSHPQTCHPHRDQGSYPYPHVYPSWESPLNGTSRYFSPGDCNGCWNHAYPPASFVPCPHPQLVQRHFHGDYPPCPNIYPAYFIPPSQYVVDQGRSHCCGCPNHSCQKKDDSGWKIEQENPGIESKNSSSSDMIQRPAYPYPLVWFPPYHMKDFDDKTPNLKDNGSSSTIQWPTYPYPAFWLPPDHMKDNNRQASEPQEHTPFDRWIPLDKSLRENEDEKIQNQQNGAKRVQLPPHIIWMPSYDQSQESKKSVRDANASPRVVEDLPPKFKIIPVNLLENENRNEKPGEEDANPGSQICATLPEKGRGPKNIPVKHVEENGLKKLDHPEKQGDNGAEKLSAREKQKEENQEKKISDSGTKKQTSPGRSSKLPPVCLRVDPLPRKKTGNDSPRSPSPPGKKEVKDRQEIKESKAGGSGGLEESKKDATMDKEIRVVGVESRTNGKPQEDDTKDMNRIVEIEDRSTSEKEGGEKNENKVDVDSTENQAGMGIEVVNGTEKFGSMAKRVENGKFGQLMGNDEVSFGHFENKFDECKKNIEESVVNKMKENAGRKFKLSETDAVLHIQAAYRGYEVRRWEPLKKLKQIARIREQVSSIKQQIHSLEVSSEGGQLDEKQWRFISETIMNLLLQLDTIQGLHPAIREIRKFVARELVSLQEKLDILSSKTTGGLVHTEAGDAPTVGDSKDALEEVHCHRTSDPKESLSREEHAQPPTEDSFGYSAADKLGRAGELSLGDCVDQNPPPNNKQFVIETRDEQIPYPETELIVRSVFENEDPCFQETEEYTKPTSPAVLDDSMAADVSELPTREHNHTIVQKAQGLQQGVQDERGEALGKGDSPADDEPEAEAEAEELHEAQAEVKQAAVKTQPFTATNLVMHEEGENAVQEEEVVPVVEDVVNIREHEVVPGSACSESPWQCEDSFSGNEALIMQDGETRQGEFLHEHVTNFCTEVDDAVSRAVPCSESTILEVDVKENGSKSITIGEYDPEDLPGYKPVNPGAAVKQGAAELPEVVGILDAPAPAYPEVSDQGGDSEHPEVDILDAPAPAYPQVPDREGDTEHPKVEIMDVTVPTCSSTGVDLADDDNNLKMPASLVEENASKEEENETNLELRGIKCVHMLQAGGTIGSVCPTEQTSLTEHEKRLIEENEKLRAMLERVLEAGNKQLGMISSLSWRVKDLEKKVARRRKLRLKQHKASKILPCNNLSPRAAVESAA